MKIFDPDSGLWITDNPWIRPVQLAPEETKTLLYYVVTPDEAGRYSFSTRVEYLEAGTYVPYQDVSADITVTSSTETETDDALAGLQALNVSGSEASAQAKVVRYLTDVKNRIVQGQSDREAMIDDLRNATSALLDIASQDVSRCAAIWTFSSCSGSLIGIFTGCLETGRA